MQVEALAQQQVESGGGVALVRWQDGREQLRVMAGSARPGFPMDEKTILLWLSSGKPITAAIIARLCERGQISLDDPVASYLPQFAAAGKERITIRHLLTHTAGLHRVLPGAWAMASWADAIERICESPVADGFTPGEHAAYDPSAAWFILGEVIARVSGDSFEAAARREVFDPADMPEAAFCYTDERARELLPRLAQYSNTALSRGRMLEWNQTPFTRFSRPGASLRTTIGEMARFYQSLLDGRLLKPETLAMFTRSARGLRSDRTFGMPMDWGLGFMVKGEIRAPYSFGPGASELAFGHGGQQTSVALADPANRSVTVAAYTTLPGERAHNQRMAQLLAQLHADLGA